MAMTHFAPHRRATWLAFVAPALVSSPALAQDATSATPPPVRATVPQTATPAPAPAPVQAPPSSSESGRPVASTGVNPQSKTVLSPEAQAALDEARAAREAQPAVAAARPVRANNTNRTAARASAPAAAATAAPAAAPVVEQAPAPVVAAVPPAPVETTPIAPTADTPATTETATIEETAEQPSGAPIWPMIALVAIAAIAIAGFLAWRRRREREEYEEEVYYEEQPVAVMPEPAPLVAPLAVAPVAAAPLAAEPAIVPAAPVVAETAATDATTMDEATVTKAEEAEVAALTEAVPVTNRPWLEFAMRPVRAGTSADEALVEIELTVANAGTVPAEDVRVSAFMLTDAHASEMENMLVDPPADAAVTPVTIAPGEGTRIDATLAALKADLGAQGSFNPVVVADARYRLPDGSEGRTCASFVVGVSNGGAAELRPFDLADRVMREDIGAKLHGEPQHA